MTLIDPDRGTDRACRWCGQPVTEFHDEGTGLRRYLEPEPLPITVDIGRPEWRYRLWQLSPVGWAPKFNPAERNWRELRAEHSCERMPRHRKTPPSDRAGDDKKKHKKESPQ